MEELKPCTFCGKEPKVKRERGNEWTGYAESVTIGCCASMTYDDDQNPKGGYALSGTAMKKAVKAWNTRHGEQ